MCSCMQTTYEFDGRHQTLKAIALATGINYSTLRERVLGRNWSVDKAVAVRVRQMNYADGTSKRCPTCGVIKNVCEFHQLRRPGKKTYTSVCLACTSDKNAAAAQAKRLKVVSHYSGGSCKCALCDEHNIWVLDIDHIDGRSPGDRRYGKAQFLSRDLLKRGLPEGFRVLCRNCNWMEHLRRNQCGPFRVHRKTG